MSDHVTDLLDYLDAGGCVCPKPAVWYDLWRTLPDRRWIGGGWEPAAPAILARWHATSDAEKRGLFRGHINWAERHGTLGSFDQAIRALEPDKWHRRAR